MAEIDQLFTLVENYNEMTIEQLQVCVNFLQSLTMLKMVYYLVFQDWQGYATHYRCS